MGIVLRGKDSQTGQNKEITLPDEAFATGGESLSPLIGDSNSRVTRRTNVDGSQYSFIVLHTSTNDATPTNAITLALEEDKSYAVWGRIIARNTDTNGETASYNLIQSTAYRDAGQNATLIGVTPTAPALAFTAQHSDGGSADWEANIVLEPATPNIHIEITGDAVDTLRWILHINIIEVVG